MCANTADPVRSERRAWGRVMAAWTHVSRTGVRKGSGNLRTFRAASSPRRAAGRLLSKLPACEGAELRTLTVPSRRPCGWPIRSPPGLRTGRSVPRPAQTGNPGWGTSPQYLPPRTQASRGPVLPTSSPRWGCLLGLRVHGPTGPTLLRTWPGINRSWPLWRRAGRRCRRSPRTPSGERCPCCPPNGHRSGACTTRS